MRMDAGFERRQLRFRSQLERALPLQFLGPQLERSLLQAPMQRLVGRDAKAGQDAQECSDLQAAEKFRPIEVAGYEAEGYQDHAGNQSAHYRVNKQRQD